MTVVSAFCVETNGGLGPCFDANEGDLHAFACIAYNILMDQPHYDLLEDATLRPFTGFMEGCGTVEEIWPRYSDLVHKMDQAISTISLQDHPFWVLCKKLLERADTLEEKCGKMDHFDAFSFQLNSVVAAARPPEAREAITLAFGADGGDAHGGELSASIVFSHTSALMDEELANSSVMYQDSDEELADDLDEEDEMALAPSS